MLLDIRNLNIDIKTRHGTFKAVENFSLTLEQGEIRALVGESGSGRSLVAKAILGIEQDDIIVKADRLCLHEPKKHSHHHAYTDLTNLKGLKRRKIMRREIAMIFQDPLSCFDPSLTIEQQITDLIPNVKLSKTKSSSSLGLETNAINLLHRAGIRNHKNVLRSYPFELSEGICQKIMLATAIAMKPRLLLADEPTSTMDTSTQTQVLRTLDKINKMNDMSILLISNDLSAIAKFAHSFSFMYCGQLVETGTREDIFQNPQHPYTKALIHAIPGFHETQLPKSDLYTLPGLIPTLESLPIGCHLGPRCPNAQRNCIQMPPERGTKTHVYRCHHPVGSTKSE